MKDEQQKTCILYDYYTQIYNLRIQQHLCLDAPISYIEQRTATANTTSNVAQGEYLAVGTWMSMPADARENLTKAYMLHYMTTLQREMRRKESDY